MIKIKQSGDFRNTETFFQKMLNRDYLSILDKYGKEGVRALSEATPTDSGKTALSWSYTIEHTREGITISWSNSNVNEGVNIALILQYGHGTGTGGYVEGIDYINPAMRPLMTKISNDGWKGVVLS